MVARCIAELLYKYDCVIIPGFGGFITQNTGASYNASQNELLPPTKKILFNNQLVINDGLLISYLSRNQKISYSEACLKVMKWTDEIMTRVNAGNRFVIDGIGSFYLNHEKKLQFTPDPLQNFLSSSFGLKPVKVAHVSKKSFKRPSETTRKPVVRSFKIAEAFSIAASIALIIASVLMFPKFEWKLVSMAGYWSEPVFTEQAKTKTSFPAEDKQQEFITHSSHDNKLAEVPVEAEKSMIGETEKSEINKEESPETFIPHPESIQMHFHVIAGCFKIEENAQKLVNQLVSEGLQAAIIGKSKSGLTMVSAGSFSSASEAVAKLAEMKPFLPDGGWVFQSSGHVPNLSSN